MEVLIDSFSCVVGYSGVLVGVFGIDVPSNDDPGTQGDEDQLFLLVLAVICRLRLGELVIRE